MPSAAAELFPAATVLAFNAGNQLAVRRQGARLELAFTGDTLAARNQLLRGPKTLLAMPHFHYNIACYLWTLGEHARARTHLSQAIAMDESYRESALTDRDLTGIGPLP